MAGAIRRALERGRRQRARLPAGRGRDPPHRTRCSIVRHAAARRARASAVRRDAAAAQDAAILPAPRRARARSCSRRRSRRRASRSTACTSSWTAGWRACRPSRRARGCRGSRRCACRARPPSSAAGARDVPRQACAIGCGPPRSTRVCWSAIDPRSCKPISRRSRSIWRSPASSMPSSLRWLDAAPCPGARAGARAARAARRDRRRPSHHGARSRDGVARRASPPRAHDAARTRARIRSDGVRRRSAARRARSDAPRSRCARCRHPASRGDRRRARALVGDVDRDTVRRVREQRSHLACDAARPSARDRRRRRVWARARARVPRSRGAASVRNATSAIVLRNGLGAVLPEGSSLTGSAYLAIAELGGQRPDARVHARRAAHQRGARGVARRQTSEHEDVGGMARRRIARSSRCVVSASAPSCFARRRCAMPSRWPWPQALLSALTTEHGLSLTWSEDASRLRARLAFLHRHVAGWPDVGDDALRATAHEWLLPHLVGLRRRQDVEALDLGALLLCATELAAARGAGRARADTCRGSERIAHPHRLFGSRGARARGAASGAVRARCDTERGAAARCR